MAQAYKNKPQVALSYELFVSTIELVHSVWKKTKLFDSKADKQTMLIIESKSTYATLINTKYQLPDSDLPAKLEDIYGQQFAQDVISEVMQRLLLS